MTIRETQLAIESNSSQWLIPFMEFVDDFRRTKLTSEIEEPIKLGNEKFDALLASTVEYLCQELRLKVPGWAEDVPSCRTPWFVSGVENLKAITIVESPVCFRRRKIFVLKNFLDRV